MNCEITIRLKKTSLSKKGVISFNYEQYAFQKYN